MTTRHDFAFARAYRLPALAFGITGSTSWVEVGPSGLLVRFGPWRLRTPLANIEREDVLRDLVLALREQEGATGFEVECESFESIHNHSAYAFHEEGDKTPA